MPTCAGALLRLVPGRLDGDPDGLRVSLLVDGGDPEVVAPAGGQAGHGELGPRGVADAGQDAVGRRRPAGLLREEEGYSVDGDGDVLLNAIGIHITRLIS